MTDLTQLFDVMGSREIARSAIELKKQREQEEAEKAQAAFSRLPWELQRLYTHWKAPRTEEGREAREMIIRGKR